MQSTFYRVLLVSFLAILVQFEVKAQVSGNVFRDFNANGIKTTAAPDPIEVGLKDVTVNAYPATGAVITTTTNASGNYTITGGTGPYRVEFILPSSYYATKGSVSNTTVQFVAAGGVANLGVNYPSDFCQNNPNIIIPSYVAGNPEGGGTGGSLDALVRFPYLQTGSTPAARITTASNIGTVWGSAYQRESKKIILSAFLKRHCGLETLGLGGLFTCDVSSTPEVVAPYINVENFGIDLGSSLIAGRTLPATATNGSNDALAFTYMGKIGMGGIDFSDDGKTLWAVNLYKKEIFSVNLGNPIKAASAIVNTDFASFAIPDPGCVKGAARPWAIKYYQGKIYVGMICSGETAGTQANLFAYIYKFNPDNNTWDAAPVVSFPLNYAKGNVHTDYPTIDKWETWANAFTDLYSSGSAGSPAVTRKMRPQPILTDIDFDKRGNLILGFSDRTGHQTGRNQYGTSGTTLFNGYIGGDILYMAANGSGGFTMESNGAVPGQTGGGANNNQGPGNGEFFNKDNFSADNGSGFQEIHQETMQGGLFYNPIYDEIMANHIDPYIVFSGGVQRHSVQNGASTSTMRYQIYGSTPPNGTFGKANGLGDLELLCNPAPLEIGNRVWIDTNNNGIQDASENGVDEVSVKLKLNGTTVQTANTTNGGNYYFTNVLPNTDYTIEIEGFASQTPISNRVLTTSNVNTNADDLRDNDATIVGANAVISYTTGSSGENNHTLDFGFSCAPIFATGASSIAATCNGTTPNNNASISLVTNAVKSSISTAGAATYNGAAFASANNVTSGAVTFSNLTGTGGTYIIRMYGSVDCFKDTTIVLPATSCTVSCMSISNVTAGPCTVTPLNYTTTTVSFTLIWQPSVTGNIILEAGSGSQVINTATATSPLIITFDQLTDGQIHLIRAYQQNLPTCEVNSSFTSPPSCTGIVGCDNTGGTVTGTAFNDLNNNGIIDGGEGGFSNITVKIYDKNDNVLATATTNTSGYYSITGLTENVRFRLEFSDIPSNLKSTIAGTDQTTTTYFSTAPDCIHLGLRDETSTMSSQDIEIGNFVWIDKDGNGVQNADELPIEGASVKLYDAAGTLVGTTTTSDGGEYYFNATNVSAGITPLAQYYIVFGMGQSPNNMLFDTLSPTALNTGVGTIPDQNDSDGSAMPSSLPGDLATMVGLPYITLTSPAAGEANHTYDMGFCARPNGGANVIQVCQPTSSLDLPDAALGQLWSALIGNPSNATINSTTGLISGLQNAGTYLFVLAAPTGNCQDTVRIILNEKPIIAGATSQVCNGETTDLTALISNYNIYINPIWKKDAADGTTVASPTAVTPTSNTDYYFIGQNAGTCADTAKITITVLSKPNLQITSATCTSPTDYKVTFIADPSVIITTSAGIVGIGEITAIPNGTNVTITASMTTGSTTCQTAMPVTAPNCACPTVNAPLASSGNYTICAGATYTAFVATTDANTEVDWYNASSGGTLLATNALSYTPTAAGTYYAEARSNQVGFETCVSIRTAFAVTVNPKPIIRDSVTAICQGASIDLTRYIANYGIFSNPIWTETTVNGTLVASPNSVTPSASKTYILVAENVSACKDTAQITVTVNALPMISLSNTNCSANNQTYSVSFVASGTQNVVSAGTLVGSQVSLIPIANAITVTTTATTGCVAKLTITPPNCSCPMVSTPISGGNKSICTGQIIAPLTVQVGNGETADWYDATSGGNLLASSTTSYTPTSAGTYYVQTRVIASNCTSNRISLTLEITPKPNYIGRDTMLCEGSTLNLNTLISNINTAINPQWYLATVASAPLSSSEINVGTTSATYFLIANNVSGCADTTQVTIASNPVPTIICSKTDVTTIGGNDGTASVTATSGTSPFTYQWSNGAATASINTLIANIYAVTVTSTNGCSSICSSIVNEPNCTEPSSVSYTAAVGTCIGATPNDDAKIDFTGITNADKIEKSEGATYTGAAYASATGTLTSGNASFTGLKHNTQYTVRIFNATNNCFVDVTITTPSKTCATPCLKVCSPVKITKL